MLDNTDLIFLGVWSFLGSVLGYLSFSIPVDKTIWYKIRRLFLSIGVGMFIAFPISWYLVEHSIFSKQLSLMLGGLGAFGLSDFIIKYWPKITESVANILVNRLSNGDFKLRLSHQHNANKRDNYNE